MKFLGVLLIITSFVFKAEAQSLSLPYYTGFDSTSQQAGWQEFRLGVLNTYNWNYDNSNIVSSPNSLFHDYDVGGSATDTIDDWFVSPPFIFDTSAQLNLKIFIVTATTVTPSDYFGIWFSSGTSNPVSGNFSELANLTNMQPQYQWLDTSITITTVTDSGYIAFRYSATDNWFQIWIDDVNIMPDSSIGTNVFVIPYETSQIKIYPNPTNKTVAIKIQSNNPQSTTISIIDIQGKTIFSETLQNSGKLTKTLDLSTYSKGIYLIKVETPVEQITQKIVIE